MYNCLVKRKRFRNEWKKARVVLIRKPGNQGKRCGGKNLGTPIGEKNLNSI